MFSSQAFPHFIDRITTYSFNSLEPVQLSPEGCFEMIFQQGDFFQSDKDCNIWRKRPLSFVGGLHQEAFNIKPTAKENKLVSVSFKPACTKMFIPDKLNTYKNKLVALNSIFDPFKVEAAQVGCLENKLEVQLKAVDGFLKNIFTPQKKSAIAIAVQEIEKSLGCLPVSEIAMQVNLSPSQFRKRFGEEIGMSPKEYSQIIRIKLIQKCLKQEVNLKLTELAYRFNYFDQAHFIKDFRAVTGSSPKSYLRKQKG